MKVVLVAVPALVEILCSAQGASPLSLRDWEETVLVHTASGSAVDTGAWDPNGHAGPFLGDVDADGRRDLILGSYAGEFHVYRNIGADEKPIFEDGPRILNTPEKPARVPTWCCVASGPNLIDINADGVPDLSAGSYAPGGVYWFPGQSVLEFGYRQELVDCQGRPIYTDPDRAFTAGKEQSSYGCQIAWIDWNADGALDIVVGNLSGELHVRLQIPHWSKLATFAPPIPSQPVFEPCSREIRIGSSKAVPGHHACPSIADWDGDGLWDILSGSSDGSVYWFRNMGRSGEPKFETREEILDKGTVLQWAGDDARPVRGVRSQIHAVDVNRDGKVDLILGAWSISQSPRADLTDSERREVAHIRSELAAIDDATKYDRSVTRYTHYSKSPELRSFAERVTVLEQRLAAFLASGAAGPDSRHRNHGRVWLFLRR
jgi:hypothetical protein